MKDELVKLKTAKLLEANKFGKAYNRYTRTSLITKTAAARWLREKKNLHIEVFSNASGYGFIIDKADNGTSICDSNYDGPNDSGVWNDFEGAMEAGIVKSLALI